MLAGMAFAASLLLLGTPGLVLDRKVILPAAGLGAFEAGVSLWIAARTRAAAGDIFSHVMIGLMVATVVAAGLVIRPSPFTAARARVSPTRIVITSLAVVAAGLALGAMHWIQLLADVPDLAANMAARAGGAAPAVLPVLRVFLVEDAMYRVFLLPCLIGAVRFVTGRTGRPACVLGLLLCVWVMAWDPARRGYSEVAAALAYGAIYLRWGLAPLVLARASAAALAWPLVSLMLAR